MMISNKLRVGIILLPFFHFRTKRVAIRRRKGKLLGKVRGGVIDNEDLGEAESKRIEI